MTTQYKDLFISYGRRESLGFVAKLHQRLKLAGYDAWFDKVNIPDGEDYAARIDHGIESAHNFVYVMAPRALCSPYCLVEIEYARYLGKRIIPINQMVIFQTEDKPLSEGDKTLLQNFYARYGLADPKLETAQQVLNRSLAVIGRTDWLDGKEKLTPEDCNALYTWAQGYENVWHKHDDLDYLRTLDLPQFGQLVDSINSIIERIQIVLERHKPYVAQHTDLMRQALAWSHNQYENHYLLVGKARNAAETWLAQTFRDGEQAPCEPNALLCDFICESRKNGENRLTDCFICYEHQDKAARDAVIQALARYTVTTWRHDKDIEKGQTYEQAIAAGIEGADNVLFFVSPHSVQSEHCLRELAHAQQYNKRLIPLIITDTPAETIPESVRSLQCIDFTDNRYQQDYERDIAEILNIVRQDTTYYQHHKILLVQALRWQRQQLRSSFLLRGHNLENAKTWLRLNQEREQHAPLALHKELITASEAAKGRLRTEVFLSYSRKNADFARKLNLSLQAAGKNVWFDQESIASGMDFEAELYKGINSADNFVFVLSPDSVTSEYCEDEVNYALSQGKRIFTLLCREVESETLPAALRTINWIDFLNTPFDKSFAELIQALDLDREHAAQHTVLQQRALEWLENQHSADFLLNNTACAKAEAWQTVALNKNKQPAPTQLQKHYTQSSRAAIIAAQTQEKRRQKWVLTSVSLGFVVALIFAGFAWIQMQRAEEKTQEAEYQKNRALSGQSLFLAKEAEHTVNNNLPLTAMRLLLEATPETSETYPDRALVDEVYSPLLYSINQQYFGIFEHEQAVTGAGFSPDNQFFLTYSGNVVYVWDVNTRAQVTMLSGHSDNIAAANYSPDGTQIVTAAHDHSARIWDSRTGEVLATLEGHSAWLNSAMYSPDGQNIVTASDDATARVWDSQSGQLLSTLEGHSDAVKMASYSPDGKHILTVSDDRTARIWDSQSGVLLTTLDGQDSYISSAAYSPDSTQIVMALTDNTAGIWDSQSGELLTTLKGHDDWVISASYSPDGMRIVTASDDTSARIWDSHTGKLLHILQGHKNWLTSAIYSPNGAHILTLSRDNHVRVWDSETGEMLFWLRGHSNEVLSATYSPDSHYIITTAKDKTARVWNSDGGQPLAIHKAHDSALYSAQYSPDDAHILTAADDGTASVWNSVTGELEFVLIGHESAVYSASYSPDGKQIVTVSADETARIWDSHTGALLRTLADGAFSEAAFSPDGRQMVTVTDNIAQVRDSETGALLIQLNEGLESTLAATFNPDGTRIVTVDHDQKVRIWESESGQLLNTLEGHNNWVKSAAYSPDGAYILTVADDQIMRIWDGESGQLLNSFGGDDDPVLSAVYSPDGTHIITVSSDNTLYLWESATGQVLATLDGHEAELNSVRYSTSGTHLVTASGNGFFRIWLTPTSLTEMVQHAQNFLPKHRNAVGAAQLLGSRLLCKERASYFLDFIERCAEVADENIRGSEYQGEFDLSTQKAHGQGESQGLHRYKGGFKQGLKHGHGIYTWADGTQWEGEFRHDLALGIGELKASATDWYTLAQDELAQYEPNLNKAVALLQTQLKVLPEHVESKLLLGEVLAKQDHPIPVLEQFKQALTLLPNLAFNPKEKLKQIQAEMLIGQATELSFETKADEIVQKIEQALQLNIETIEAASLAHLCWQGALNQQVKSVLKLCELAVKKEPDNADYIDARGLARALTGDFNGAIADFQFYIKHVSDDELAEEMISQRQAWIKTLEKGKNPFNKAVLNSLR